MERLKPFIPDIINSLLVKGEDKCFVEGCVLFADVAGFTPLTEALAKIGKEGSEELTRILNGFFSAMIDIIYAENGDVLRFGGDAMTIFFPNGVDEGLSAALRMQKEAGLFQTIETRGGSFSLAMKIGISYGKILFGILGDANIGKDYFAAGEALDLSADAEHRVTKGQIALCPKSLAALGNIYATEGFMMMDDGFGLIESPASFRFQEDILKPKFKNKDLSSENLASFLPSFIVERSKISHGFETSEHRKTSVVFLSFKGIDYNNDPAAYEKINSVYREVSSSVIKYGGIVNKFDMGDKGSKALILYGTPKAIENQEEMACRSSLEIMDNKALKNIVSDMKIGITSSNLFAAYVGSNRRREYTVMGDGINLAARLMTSAHSFRILTSRGVADAASSTLFFRALDSIFVKGKSDKVEIFRPEGERESRVEGKRSFIGREEIQKEIMQTLIDRNSSSSILINGEAGVGKTAIFYNIFHQLSFKGIRYIYVPLASFSIHSNLAGFKGVFLSCLGIAKGDSPEVKVEALRQSMKDETPEYLPLFSQFLGVDIEEGSTLKAASAKERKDLTFAMLSRLILKQIEERPYCIFIDNLQFSDPATLDFLAFLSIEAGQKPLKIALSTRPGLEGTISERISSTRKFNIPPFTLDELKSYLSDIISIKSPSEALCNFLYKKSHGNAQYLEQILSVIKREGILKETPVGIQIDEDLLSKTKFPDTLEGMLLSQVDELQEKERHLLKSASILGSSFSLSVLSAILSRDTVSIKNDIQELSKKGIVKLDSWGERPYATFNESLLRDALYESLNFAEKRALHQRVAEFLEMDGANEKKLWPVLAHHFECAEAIDKAQNYLYLSAEIARERYDNKSADELLSRYILLCEKVNKLDERYNKCLLYKADCARNLGRIDIFEEYATKAYNIIQDKTADKITARMYLAGIQMRRGNIKESISFYEETLNLAIKLNDCESQCKIFIDSGVPRAMIGDIEGAKKCFKNAEEIAKLNNIVKLFPLPLTNLGLIEYLGGNHDKAISYLKMAIKADKIANLSIHLADTESNLSQIYFDKGEYRKAIKYTSLAIEKIKPFGFRSLILKNYSNLALYLLMLGKIDASWEINEKALSEANTFKIKDRIGYCLNTKGIILAKDGRIEEAINAQWESIENLHKTSLFQHCLAPLQEILSLALLLSDYVLARAVMKKQKEIIDLNTVDQNRHERITFESKLLRYRFRIGKIDFKEAKNSLNEMIKNAISREQYWLASCVGEDLIEILMENKHLEEAKKEGLKIADKIKSGFCPLYDIPFLLSLSRALLLLEDYKSLQGVINLLKRYSNKIKDGIYGIFYNTILYHLHLHKEEHQNAEKKRAIAIKTMYDILKNEGGDKLTRAISQRMEVAKLLKGTL